MPELSLEEFAALTGVPVADVEAYRDAGLLDTEGRGAFFDPDVLAMQYISRSLEGAASLNDAIEALRESDDPIARRMFQRSQYPLEEVAARIGTTPAELRALGTALGFQVLVFNDEDVAALALADVMTRSGLPPEALFEGARVYGDGLRRIADELVHLGHRFLCEPLAAQGEDPVDIGTRTGESFAQLGAAAVGFVAHLYVDYLVRALSEHTVRHLRSSKADDPTGTNVATVVFADLALFSTLAELEGDEAAFDLVDRTDAAVRELVLRHRGHLVKHIGDEFMLVFRDPADAVRFACDLQTHIAENERHAATRIGIHQGPILYRLGDYYGRAVNAASRIVSMAMGNSILVTESIAAVAESEGIGAEAIGVRTLRGTEEPLALYRVDWRERSSP